MVKNYNKLTGLYRFKKWKKDNPNYITVDFYNLQTIKEFTKTGNKTYTFFGQDFMEFDYKHYFFLSLYWFFLRLSRKFKNSKYPNRIKYAARNFIIPVVVIIIASIIYELWIKDLLKQ